MKTRQVLAGLALGLGLAVPAAAQQAPPAGAPAAEEMGRAGDEQQGYRGSGPRGEQRRFGREGGPGAATAGWQGGGWQRGHGHRRPLFSFVMRHRQELALTPAQMESFQKLATDYRRDAIKREAEVKLARVDLGTLLRPDPANPGKQVDMGWPRQDPRDPAVRGDMMVNRRDGA
jgi:hypothetical protein